MEVTFLEYEDAPDLPPLEAEEVSPLPGDDEPE
jgi:hypothetical protein